MATYRREKQKQSKNKTEQARQEAAARAPSHTTDATEKFGAYAIFTI